MEFLLLWIDELDDAFCAARHLAPKILGFVFAVGLLIGTGLVLSRMPQAVLVVVAVALSVTLMEGFRRRAIRPLAEQVE